MSVTVWLNIFFFKCELDWYWFIMGEVFFDNSTCMWFLKNEFSLTSQVTCWLLLGKDLLAQVIGFLLLGKFCLTPQASCWFLWGGVFFDSLYELVCDYN